jgi:hypothetical protein
MKGGRWGQNTPASRLSSTQNRGRRHYKHANVSNYRVCVCVYVCMCVCACVCVCELPGQRKRKQSDITNGKIKELHHTDIWRLWQRNAKVLA